MLKGERCDVERVAVPVVRAVVVPPPKKTKAAANDCPCQLPGHSLILILLLVVCQHVHLCRLLYVQLSHRGLLLHRLPDDAVHHLSCRIKVAMICDGITIKQRAGP